MAQTESTLKNMVVSLLVITLISGVSLGAMYKLTKEPIEASRLAKQQQAISDVTLEFDNNPVEESFEVTSPDGFVLKLFPAKKNGELVATAVESVSNKGFGGEVKIMVGFRPDGTIINYQVLDHKETPGLGTKWPTGSKPIRVTRASSEKIRGSNNLTVKKDGGEVDAITAATISSRAFLDALATAFNAIKTSDIQVEEAYSDSLSVSEGGIQ